ncbi:hypothetical protein LBMAG27_21780 [Bacteroidota bacterium]|nr:hypothetical protein LBMAG27_21780 [Bacteroidota bacterium]
MVELYQDFTTVDGNTNDNSITVFPNPAHENFYINCTETTSYAVQDLTGRTIQQGIISKPTELNCIDWARGVYFVTLQTAEGKQIKKLVKD